MKKIAGLILKELLVQIILSTVLVVILAFIVFKLSLGDGIIRIMILAIYGICSLIGGLILGKNIQKRKFLWGLVAGAIYIGLIMGISFMIRDETGDGAIGLGTGVAVALGFGTFGGILETMKKGGCGECQTSCQSACKTSCTVGNQTCENK